MITVTFDELELNAVLASLDDRLKAMGRQLCTLKEQADSPSNAFAIDATRDAIRHAMQAQLTLASALPDPEFPPTASWSVVEQYQAEGR